MQRHLKLSEEQVQQLETVLLDWEKRVTRIDERRLAEKLDLFRELVPQLRAHLRPEQQVLFDDVAERAANRQKRFR